MGQRFQITESERQRIKGLYEQPEQQIPNQEEPEQDIPTSVRGRLELEELAHAHISEYTVFVKPIGQEYDYEECAVKIKLNSDGNFYDAEVEYNHSDDISDDEIFAFVTRKGEEGAFNKIPVHMAWDMKENKPFDFN
jgi:hypothetical protein